MTTDPAPSPADRVAEDPQERVTAIKRRVAELTSPTPKPTITTHVTKAQAGLLHEGPAVLAFLLERNDKLQELVDEAAYRLGDLVCDKNDLSMENEQYKARAEELTAQLDAARALHKPVRRYTIADGDAAFEFPNDAAEWFDVPDEQVTFFEVCEHCGDMEIGDEPERSYRESLWPCADAKALGIGGVSDVR